MNMARRKICVVTATRAEYGLLYWLLQALRDQPDVELQLVVTGTHLSARFGSTVGQIEADGFRIAARVPLPVTDDSVLGITRSLSQATSGLGAAFASLRPDLLILLGDRYEMLAAAQSAMVARIPIAHIHGGETTEGAIDEAIRHAVTKMSHLHFVAAEEFRRRVIQLGEAPERVWNVGATGLDNIERLTLLSRPELESALGIGLSQPSFLVTYHPVTLDARDQGVAMRTMLDVLDETGGTVIITGVNADTGGQAMREQAQEFAAARAGRVLLAESLGSLRYLSAMAHVDAVVGNSSSGLIEAPALGKPSVDIGERQRGRPRAPSVVHCPDDADAIRRALSLALTPRHQALARQRVNPYGLPGAAARIAAVVRTHSLAGLIFKRFHDLEEVR